MPKIVKLSDLNKKEKEKILQQTKKEVEERKAKIESEISFTSKNKSANTKVNLPINTSSNMSNKATKLPTRSWAEPNNTNIKVNIKDIANTVSKNQKEKEEKNKFINKSGISTIGSNIGHIAKSTGTGAVEGAAGSVQGVLTDTANQFNKGSEKDIGETSSNFLKSIIGITNPGYNITNIAKDIPNKIKSILPIIADKDKSVLEKATSIALDAVSDAKNNSSIGRFVNSANQLTGSINKDAGKSVMEVNEKISLPINKMKENIAEEREKYNGFTQTIGQLGQTVGNMTPSIVASKITGNPTIALGTMGLSVKGQATQEALNKGASLDQAVKIGDTKAMVELGTEMLTGGVNIFGKGALDDLIEKGIDKKVKNAVANFLIKKGLDIPEEIVEETISDVLNTTIDKGTVDPNASYSFKDWSDTALVTTLSTIVLNSIGGGYGKTAYLNNAQKLQQQNQITQPTQQIQEQKNTVENNQETLYNNNERESGINDTERNNNKFNETEEIISNQAILPENANASTGNEISRELYEQNRKEIENVVKQEIKNNYGFKDDITNNIYEKISKKENLSREDIYEAFNEYREISGEDVSDDIKQTVNEIKRLLRTTKIDTSVIKGEIADYRDLYRHNFNRVSMGNNGIAIDSLYKELVQTFPGYFDENINNPTDQLLSIIEWRDVDAEELLKPTTYTLTDSDLEDTVNTILTYQEYLNSIKPKDSNKSSFIMPTPEKTMQDVGAPINNTNKNTEMLTDKDYEVLNKIYEKEGRTEVLTEKRKASLLEKYASDKYKFKDSMDLLSQKFINKGHYIDKLSEQAKNPELKFIYDKNLNSFAEGQYSIGVAQTDNSGNAIGKSINEIWKPVEDSNLTKKFSEYLLHKHNIDRSGRNKYVFGEEIGPTESTAIALALEQKYPEFKQYAEDIKRFNHNNLENMKKAGLINQEAIDYMESMYPNYIPILRNIEDTIYTGSKEETGTTAPIKKATGGNSDIQPIKDAMAQQVIRIKRLVNQNNLGKELAKTLKNAKVEESVDIELTPSLLFDIETMVETDSEGNKYYTYFENGKQQKLKINDNLYESLRPTEINRLEKTLPVKALQKVTNIHRSLLTSSNPLFVVTNFFKDFQDGAFNSKYSRKFIKNYGKALSEIVTKGKYYQSYMANGGMTNTYFDYSEGVKKKGSKFLNKIRNVNEIVEQLPRLSEFISTLEDGKSLNEALYNSAEITTNFKRGGDITKALNRNGVNFLNASIQGLDKQFRNIKGQNGIKGYVNLLAKATIMSIAPSILNHMLLDDDEDYQDLPQSTKDLYYLFKYDDGKFIRIPKGRVLSIFGAAARRTIETVQGQEDSWQGFGDTIKNQVAPNNPLEDNILAPITQVKNNKTWYGTDLVSSRLQQELPKNQYDETTDELSKWLGSKLNISPKKINYLLDQYSGALGDILLPIITPQAKQNVVADKFTTDSVLKNKNVSAFYETLEKQTQIANDSFATDEDEIQLKYLNSISRSMSDLYKEKRQIQMSNISNKEKTKKVREIQEQINKLAEEGLNNYKNTTQGKAYSKVGNEEYYKNSSGEWTKLSEEEKEKMGDISIEIYSDYKQKIYKEKNKQVSKGKLKKSQDLKDKDKIQILLDSKYTDKQITLIYETYIRNQNEKEYATMSKTGIDIKEYLKYKQQDFESDKKDDGTTTGKTISGSKKKKVYNYVNNMKIDYEQKLLLLGMQYSLKDSEKTKLANYINSLKITKDDKLEIYDRVSGFKVYKNGTVKW